jgi:hypothetical protein
MTRVALAQGLGQVLGLAAPHVDLEEAGVAVAPLAVLLDPLGHGHPEVGDGDAVLGEADLGVLDQVARRWWCGCHLLCRVFLPGAYNVDTLGYEERVAAEAARTQPGRPVRPAGRRGSAAVGVAVALLALLL